MSLKMTFTTTETGNKVRQTMTERVFITGDKHGSFGSLFGLAEKNELHDSDILIIAGDAGYVWNEDYIYKVETLQQLFPGTITFIDGNHENFDILNDLEVIEWNGGKVHRVGERVLHLMRGQIYTIYGKNYFTFGGARSVDKDRRVEGESWWDGEEPTEDEIADGRKRLIDNLDDIDYVITHEAPLFARRQIPREKPIDDDYRLPEIMEEWYELIKDGKRFTRWYFGHMHVDQVINEKLRALHVDIRTIGYDEYIRWA